MSWKKALLIAVDFPKSMDQANLYLMIQTFLVSMLKNIILVSMIRILPI